ncbi:hypothetical protein [Limnohabitans sp. 63ED37-2]|uniref:hypothetical protein n=1 Tax=Limnohabitans sp. 63ED37-2 TaxID=1678128 RepID=UPI00070633B1|nr:hypothetical protein [Limnohabitans sp. 63ED37-2]ALK87786.1 hypothetical protein L63ED372_00559 [Limnohabitans sp. 63ED37-2]
MKAYKTQGTALKHVKAGENFKNKVFRHFWTDKEVCKEALAREPNLFRFIVEENYNQNIEWDSEFIASAFLRMLETKPSSLNLARIGPFLPPEITESKEIASRTAQIDLGEWRRYFSPDLSSDQNIRNAHRPFGYTQNCDLSEELQALLYQRTDFLVELVKASPGLIRSLPGHLGAVRGVKVIACVQAENFLQATGGLHDDEEFVLEVLKELDNKSNRAFPTCSYRIRKAVGYQDPVQYLEAVVQAKKLDALLSHKTSNLEPIKQKSLKI